VKVEQALAEEGLTKEDVGREAFVERVWDWRKDHGSQIVEQFKRLGASLDYGDERFTMDSAYAEAVVEVFVALYEKGLIYRDNYLVNWDPGSRSAISDLEVEEREVSDTLYFIDYPLASGGGSLTIATVRPETMLADTAIAVHYDVMALVDHALDEPTPDEAKLLKDWASDHLKSLGVRKLPGGARFIALAGRVLRVSGMSASDAMKLLADEITQRPPADVIDGFIAAWPDDQASMELLATAIRLHPTLTTKSERVGSAALAELLGWCTVMAAHRNPGEAARDAFEKLVVGDPTVWWMMPIRQAWQTRVWK
jgi:hypothetical protein